MSDCKKCVSEKVCRYNDGHNLYCKEDYKCPHFIELIKCKDCESFINRNGMSWCEEHSDGWGDCTVYVDEDDFCSYGERKCDNG